MRGSEGGPSCCEKTQFQDPPGHTGSAPRGLQLCGLLSDLRRLPSPPPCSLNEITVVNWVVSGRASPIQDVVSASSC